MRPWCESLRRARGSQTSAAETKVNEPHQVHGEWAGDRHLGHERGRPALGRRSRLLHRIALFMTAVAVGALLLLHRSRVL